MCLSFSDSSKDKDHFEVHVPTQDNYILSFQKEGIDSPSVGEELVGTWSSGYECNGQRSIKRINIEQHANVLTAIRLDGDDCISLGYIQFYMDLDSGVCQWARDNSSDTPLDVRYTCSPFSGIELLSISFPNHEERKEMVFRRIAGIARTPIQVSENLSITIPYAEYQVSPTETRTIQAHLELVPRVDSEEMLWKLSDADFLD